MYDEWTEQFIEVETDDISTPWKQGRDKIVDAHTGVNRLLDRLFEEQLEFEEELLNPAWADYGIM